MWACLTPRKIGSTDTASSTAPPLPLAVKQAVAALDSPIQTERLNALESLAALVAKYPVAQEKLAEAVQLADYPDVRIHAAFMLVQFKDVRAVPGLVEALQDRSSTINFNTLPELFKFDDVNRYNNFLYNSNLPPDMKVFPRCYVAIFALGQIQNVIATQELLKTLNDEDTLMRRFAALSMKFLGDPTIISILCKALKDEEWLVREAVTWTLGRIGDNKIIADLTALLSDESYEVRSSAIDALKHIGTPEALEAIDLWRKAQVDSIIQGW
jgi:HEAT repeat protein